MQDKSYPPHLMPPDQAFQFVREWFATERGAELLRWWLKTHRCLSGEAMNAEVQRIDRILQQDTLSPDDASEIGGILQDGGMMFMIEFLPRQYPDLPGDATDYFGPVRAVFIHFTGGTIHDLAHHMETWDEAATARAKADHERRQAERAAEDKLKGLKDPVLDYDLAERCPEC